MKTFHRQYDLDNLGNSKPSKRSRLMAKAKAVLDWMLPADLRVDGTPRPPVVIKRAA